MKRIALYRTPVAAYDFKKKYLLFFELAENADMCNKDFIQTLESPNWLKSLGESTNRFREIYKKEPSENYIDEWVVKTKLPEGVVDKHSWILFTRSFEKKLPVQEDKTECQKIARGIWKEYLLDIKYMKIYPDIKKITGKRYRDKTIHNWLSEVAPSAVKQKGRRSKDYEKTSWPYAKN